MSKAACARMRSVRHMGGWGPSILGHAIFHELVHLFSVVRAIYAIALRRLVSYQGQAKQVFLNTLAGLHTFKDNSVRRVL